MKHNFFLTAFVCSIVLFSGIISEAKKKKPKPKPIVELTAKGEELQKTYTEMLNALQVEIKKALPQIDPEKQAAVKGAFKVEKAALADAQKAENALKSCRGKEGHLQRMEKWQKNVPNAIAEAKNKLEKVMAMPDGQEKTKALEKAKKNLAKQEANVQKSAEKVAKAKEELKQAKIEEPSLVKENEAAIKALEAATANSLQAIQNLGLDAFLASDKLDAKLAKYIILKEATPRGLAEFAQQGTEKEKVLEQLFSNKELMVQMLVADGAKDGKYGKAMEIYNAIQKASDKAKDGVLQRLALAIGLEHAVPRGQRNAKALTDAPKNVDPVKRYLSYEKAYLNDELDPGFKDQSVFNLKMVVDGEEPDEISAWGRKMLRNYRPDHITTDDYKWRYVKAVKTDVRYGSQDNKYDKPEQQFFQNILMNGGVCGRRAFFGRFILRAFGVPTTARPQPGHAALAHWTPDGWVVCLGAGWRWGTTKTRYKKDLDFLATTQAREDEKDFMKVKRAQWIGDVVGEDQIFGLNAGEPQFWYCVSLIEQGNIIEKLQAQALEAVGTDIGEANESKVKDKIDKVEIPEEERKITVDADGVITIPAAACTKPTNSTDKIKFMKSNLGGMQLHYERTGKGNETFEYTFEAPKAGKYKLTARVVTPSWKQHLTVAANGKEPVDIALPYTVGMWDTTEPVEIELNKGENVLTFSRNHEGLKGITIRDFKLVPEK